MPNRWVCKLCHVESDCKFFFEEHKDMKQTRCFFCGKERDCRKCPRCPKSYVKGKGQ